MPGYICVCVCVCVCVRALQAVCALAHALLRLDAAEWTPVLESASGPCTPALGGGVEGVSSFCVCVCVCVCVCAYFNFFLSFLQRPK